MALSTGKNLYIDSLLSNVAINYRPQTFIADLIAPIVNVPKETGIFPVFNKLEAYQAERTERARGTEANKITRSVSSMGYTMKNYALGYDQPIEDKAAIDPQFAYELDAGASRYLVGKLLLGMDIRVLGMANAATNVSTTFVPNSSWATAGANAGDPAAAILNMIEQQKAVTGISPNSMLVGWRAHNWMRRNYHIRNLINGVNNGGGFVTRERLAALFEVDRYIVAETMYSTQNEATNPNSLSLTPVFDPDKIVLYYRPPGPSRDDPSWMYAFRWTPEGYPAPMAVERHPYDSRRKIEGIEAGYFQSEQVVGRDLAVAIAGVSSAQANGV